MYFVNKTAVSKSSAKKENEKTIAATQNLKVNHFITFK